MPDHALIDVLRTAQDRNTRRGNQRGVIAGVDPVGRIAKVRINAGTAPVDVIIPDTIDPTTLNAGMVVAVNTEQAPAFIVQVVGGLKTAAATTALERRVSLLETAVSQLVAQVAALLADQQEGAVSDQIRNALMNQYNAGSAGVTQESGT